MSFRGTHDGIPPGARLVYDEDLSALIKNAAEAGATAALARLGLTDEKAAGDIHDLRSLLEAWRTAKRSALSTVVGIFVKGAIVVFFIGLMMKLGIKFPE